MRKSEELMHELMAVIKKSIDKQKSLNPEKATNANDTYILSFMTDDLPEIEKKRMTVNNNFNSERLGSNQVYMERGDSNQAGPPPNNIQLLSPNGRG
ncbi:unnamed protein product [Diamesa tonsa]